MTPNSSYTKADGLFGKTKTVKGLTLYPVTMKNYSEWLEAKPALLLRLSSLPAEFAVMPYASAIFAMEVRSIEEGEPIGLLRRMIEYLCLSLRISVKDAEGAVRFSMTHSPISLQYMEIYGKEAVRESVRYDPDKNGFLLQHEAIRENPDDDFPLAYIFIGNGIKAFPVGGDNTITDKNKELDKESRYETLYFRMSREPVSIVKPFEFNKIREAIADINGEALPDESENLELIEAHTIKGEMSNFFMKYDITDMIDSVAFASHIRADDIMEWTIREFETRKRTIDRNNRFFLNGIAEGNGATWKNGNPVPSWMFDREEDKLRGFTPVGEVMGKMGSSERWLEQQIDSSKKG